MQALVEKEVAGIKFSVRELTLSEIRAWMKTFGEKEVDVVDVALLENFDLADLRHLTTLTAEDLDRMTPTQLRTVMEYAKAANIDFFGLRQRAADLSRSLLAATLKSQSQS